MQNNNNQENILIFFVRGFSLLNQNINLYITYIIIGLIPIFIRLIPNLPSLVSVVMQVILFIIEFLLLSFSLSIPYFLSLRQNSNIINSSILWRTILHNAKRLIGPIIVFTLIFLPLFIIGMIIIIGLSYNKSPLDYTRFLENIQQGWNPTTTIIVCVFYIIFSCFTFASIFFSIENIGMIKSLFKSIVFSFRHPKILFIIIIISVSTYLNTGYINLIPVDKTIIAILTFLPMSYVNLGVLASALLYYQNIKSKENNLTQG